MRRPYEILKKAKSIQKQYAEEEFRRKLSVCPENCGHNKELLLSDGKTSVRVCTTPHPMTTAGIPLRGDGRLLTCQKISQASQCSSYSPRFSSQQEVIAFLSAEDPFTRRRKYPDAFALNWVLDEDMHGLRSYSPDVLTRFLFSVISLLEAAIRRLNKKQNVVDPSKNTEA